MHLERQENHQNQALDCLFIHILANYHGQFAGHSMASMCTQWVRDFLLHKEVCVLHMGSVIHGKVLLYGMQTALSLVLTDLLILQK